MEPEEDDISIAQSRSRGSGTLRWPPSAFRRLMPTVAMAAVLASVGGCAALFPPPLVEIVGVELVSLGLTSGTVAVTLDLTNESSRDVEISGFLYELEVKDSEADGGWKSLAGGFHSESVVLSKEDVERVTLPVPFEYQALGAAIRSFLAQGEIPYRLQGKVSVKGFGMGFDVPFHSEGVLRP